ncbi:MAG: hypothetical protein IPM56_19030 [Ignavibacteriales bacterium]|nr:MAG: hypothetical protein IPM56_19030 [Ignavibacteriales bacterium]
MISKTFLNKSFQSSHFNYLTNFSNLYLNRYSLTFCLLVFLINASCDKNPTGTGDNIGPGSRNYTWFIDTISSNSIQNFLSHIWGNSPNDIWICGFDANNVTSIYRFNGVNWYPELSVPPTHFLKTYNGVSGIDSNSIIFAGGAEYINTNPPPDFLDSALIVKSVNQNWEITVISETFSLYSLCVISPSDIWAGDRKGNMIHYNGVDWSKISLTGENVFLNQIEALSDNDIYCNGHLERKIGQNDFYSVDFLFHYDGNNWTVVDSNVTSANFNRESYPTFIKNIDGKLYGSMENSIVKKVGDVWEPIGLGFFGQINGTDDNNIFLGNQYFGVLHYNGKDWFTFYELPKLYYSGIVVFDRYVFLIASDGYKSIVVRGILNGG